MTSRLTVAGLAITVVAAASVLPLSALLTSASASESTSTHSAKGVSVSAGAIPGTVELRSKQKRPLAIVAISVGGEGTAQLVARGTNFADPTVWLRMNAGALCWRETPTTSTRNYTVRPVRIPFRAPAADWEYSTIVLTGSGAPQVSKAPLPGDVLSSAKRIRRVTVCVDAPKVARARPTAAATASTSSASSAPVSQASSDKKITICHATASTSNPYNLITVATSAAENGHGGHTGPLYPEPGWGDVIPPFGDFPGLNWPAGSQLVADGCVPAAPEGPTDPPGIEIEPPNPIRPMPPLAPPMIVRPPIGVLPSASPSPTSASVTPTTPTRPTVPGRPTARPTQSLVPVPSTTPSTSGSPRPTVTPIPLPTFPVATGSPTGAVPTEIIPTPLVPVTNSPSVPPTGRLFIVVTNGWKTFTIDRSVRSLQRLAGVLPDASCTSRVRPEGDATNC